MKTWAFLIACCAMAGLLAAKSASAQTGVLIHRGAATEVLGAATIERGVVVERGRLPAAKPSPAVYAQPARAVGKGASLQAGRTLWLLDADGTHLKACRLGVTSNVGERVVRCFDHRMVP